MKRFLLATGLFTFLTLTSSAQEGLSLQGYGAWQTSFLLNSADTDSASIGYVSTNGIAAGLGLNYHFNDKWGLGVDAIYSAQGQHLQRIYSNELFVAFENIDLNYVKFPISLIFNTDPDSKFMYRASIGPQLQFLLKANRKFSQTIFYDEVEADVRDEYKKFNFGLSLTQGVAYRLNKKLHIFLDYRLDYMFSDAENKSAAIRDLLADLTTVYDPTRPKTHNATIGAALGVSLKLERR